MLSGLVSSGLTGPTRSRARQAKLTLTGVKNTFAGPDRFALDVVGGIARSNAFELSTTLITGGSAVANGLEMQSAGQMYLNQGGNTAMKIFGGVVRMNSANGMQIGGSGAEVTLVGTLNVLEQRSTTSAQTFRVFNTWTSPTSFERANISWIGNVLTFGTEKGSAGGFARALAIQTDGITQITVGTNGLVSYPTTITTAGVTGDKTIDKLTGTVNIAAAGTSVVVTNSLVSVNSIVFCVIRTNDTTARIANVVPGAGSFTVNIVATTAEVSIGFLVVN